MLSLVYFMILVPILGGVLLGINLLLAPHVPYKEKKTPFECGYHSFLQTRLPIEIKPIIFGLMFVIFDVEILFAFPFVVSTEVNEQLGLYILLLFMIILCLGFVYELGKGALTIDSRQNDDIMNDLGTDKTKLTSLFSGDKS